MLAPWLKVNQSPKRGHFEVSPVMFRKKLLLLLSDHCTLCTLVRPGDTQCKALTSSHTCRDGGTLSLSNLRTHSDLHTGYFQSLKKLTCLPRAVFYLSPSSRALMPEFSIIQSIPYAYFSECLLNSFKSLGS